MEVVRGDGFQARELGDLRELMVELRLRHAAVGAQALVLQLDVEVALVEAGSELPRPRDGVVELAVVQKLRDDARDAGGRPDDAVPVLLQHGERGARLVVEVVDVGFADQVQQVMVALVGLCQEKQMVQLRLHVLAQFLVGGEVNLAAVDGLDLLAGFLFDRSARVAELGHARHDAVVGDGDGGHVELGRAANHVLHVGKAVEQGIFGVVMQMNERHGYASNRLGNARGVCLEDAVARLFSRVQS